MIMGFESFHYARVNTHLNVKKWTNERMRTRDGRVGCSYGEKRKAGVYVCVCVRWRYRLVTLLLAAILIFIAILCLFEFTTPEVHTRVSVTG